GLLDLDPYPDRGIAEAEVVVAETACGRRHRGLVVGLADADRGYARQLLDGPGGVGKGDGRRRGWPSLRDPDRDRQGGVARLRRRRRSDLHGEVVARAVGGADALGGARPRGEDHGGPARGALERARRERHSTLEADLHPGHAATGGRLENEHAAAAFVDPPCGDRGVEIAAGPEGCEHALPSLVERLLLEERALHDVLEA